MLYYAYMDANIRWTKGRGATKFSFTYEDLAQITGLNINTLRQYAWNKRFDPKNLSSVVLFLAPYLLKDKVGDIVRQVSQNDTA